MRNHFQGKLFGNFVTFVLKTLDKGTFSSEIEVSCETFLELLTLIWVLMMSIYGVNDLTNWKKLFFTKNTLWKLLYSWVPNSRPIFINFFPSRTFLFQLPIYWFSRKVSNPNKRFQTIYLYWLFWDLDKWKAGLYCVLFCKFVERSKHILFCFAS